MNKTTTFNLIELQHLQKLYKKNLSKFLIYIVGVLFGGFLLLKVFEKVPAEFFGRKARGRTGPLIESTGYTIPIIVILIFMLYIIIVIVNELKILKLKKDLKNKEKITATLKVKRIKNLSNKEIKEMRGLGEMNTSDLIFEKNDFGIKLYSFNKFELPAFLEAKELYIEMAKYSKIEFKREIKK